MPAPIKPSLFIDASAWAAIEYTKDANHDAAMTLLDSLQEPDRRYGHLHTSLHALLEAHGWLLHHASPAHADHLLQRIQRGVLLHETSREAFWAAAARRGKETTEEIELAVLLAAVLMDEIGITTVWSYDRAFEALGYERVG